MDRPGFGLSTYTPRSSLRDFADDVNHLAEYLEIDKFTLIGISAGGPSAIIYTALFPDRVTQAVIIGSPSLPLNVDERFSGLERIIVKLASKFETIGIWYLKQERDVFFKLATDAEPRENKKLLEMLSEDDARLFEDNASRNGLYRTSMEFHRQGDDSIRSIYEERMLWMKGWDVDLSQIPPGRVYILHGSDDKMTPVGNAYRNAEAVPGAHLEIVEGKGHFFWLDNLEKLDEILR